jgi:foldase protein PrsA
MQLLVSFQWIDGEAKARGIKRSFREQRRQSFPRESDYREFLATSGQTEADIPRRVRLDLLSNKLRDRVVRGAETERGQERVLDRFVKRFTAHWRAKTVCGEQYRTDGCGSTLPVAQG